MFHVHRYSPDDLRLVDVYGVFADGRAAYRWADDMAATDIRRVVRVEDEGKRERCTNAEPGTFNHECGKPASLRGLIAGQYGPTVQHFCDDCRKHGHEARRVSQWAAIRPGQ